MSTFTLHTLGCGSAKPSVRHNPASTVLDIRGNLYMIDCGEGTQQAFQRQRLKFTRLNHIFLTHLHGDHCLGLIGMLSTMSLIQRGGKVCVYTFRQGIELFEAALRFFGGDMTFEVEFREIRPESATIYDDKAISIRTIPLNHRVPTVGYVVEEKPALPHIDRAAADYYGVPYWAMRAIKEGEPFVTGSGEVIPASRLTRPADPPVSYAHISDTAPSDGLAEAIGPVSLLMHETTYTSDLEADAHKRGHSTAADAARTALRAGASRLLTGHYSSRIHDEGEILREAQSIFPATILNREGLTLPLD